MEINAKTRNNLFFVILAFVIAGIVINSYRGQEQDAQWRQDYLTYLNSIKNVQENKGNDAEDDLILLTQKYPESWMVRWQLARCYSSQREWQKAEIALQEVRKLNPAIILEPRYLYEAGEVLSNLGKKAEATLLLERISSESEFGQKAKLLMERMGK